SFPSTTLFRSEGEIPKGEYGAGRVQIWDSGVYELEKWRDDEVIVTLDGRRGRRRIALIRTDGDQWLAHLMAPRARPAPSGGSLEGPTLADDGGREPTVPARPGRDAGDDDGPDSSPSSAGLPLAAPGEQLAPMLASNGTRADV